VARRGVVLVALAAGLLGAVLWAALPRASDQPSAAFRAKRFGGWSAPPGPTAAEESGLGTDTVSAEDSAPGGIAPAESDTGRPPIRQPSRSVRRSRPLESHAKVKALPMRTPPRAGSSPSATENPLGNRTSPDSAQSAPVVADKRPNLERAGAPWDAPAGGRGSAGEGSAGAPAPAPAQPRPADLPAPTAPIVTAPTLLSDPAAEAGPVRVTVDRSMLTPQARLATLEGVVVLAVLVRSDGSAGDVRVRTTSGDQALDAAAVRAAETWRFRPATRDGVPVEAWAIIPVRYVVR
jgi:periplasmic protein TonB